jgi:hypothetical protein
VPSSTWSCFSGRSCPRAPYVHVRCVAATARARWATRPTALTRLVAATVRGATVSETMRAALGWVAPGMFVTTNNWFAGEDIAAMALDAGTLEWNA